MKTMILFYSPKEIPYGCFSNFSQHRVIFGGRTWETAEHIFQAMKFYPHRPDIIGMILNTVDPKQAAKIGRSRQNPIRPDWDNIIPTLDPQVVDDGRGPAPVIERVKDQFMYAIVQAKFTQHPDLQKVLLSTEASPILENTTHDSYWGWGLSQTGMNRLGKILMAIRSKMLKSSPGK
jgi:predicted NAD-dependent protein-ADP-ribosyltransferase YbiA (DUF1768 family)